MRLRQGLAYVTSFIAIVAVMALLPHCGSQYALLLSIQAKKANYLVEVFDLRVKNIATGEIILERIGEKVDNDDPNRDISEPGKELKIAVEFSVEGNYLVYFLGRSGAGTEGGQFALRDYQIDEVREETLRLDLLVGDKDGDGYPACGPPQGITCPPTNCTYLDCDDNDNTIHPFAKEICQDKKDNDCSAGCNAAPGKGDAPCVDNDGDKVPAGPDCDDNDPCKSPYLKEARNLCKTSDSDWNTQWSQACKDKLAKEGKPYTPPFCGDGVDQDCDGGDTACKVDKDCDDYSPPEDCNDNDPKINQSVSEVCGDNKDNNCNKLIDEGCRPCDIDGDDFAPTDYKGSDCPKLPRKDTDDYDAGVNPDTTKKTQGAEGGIALGALREFCSYDKEKNGVKRHRDVDHDGDGKIAAADGCPAENCDKDGDGFKGAQCSPPKSLEDCDDNDEKIFPDAPDKCGDGIKQNCTADKNCASCGDTDNDGYCAADDCNPTDAKVHPWATEKCDDIDNDCDDLVDEGNPDPAGVPIRTDIKLCNDDNDGLCAPASKKLSGICACSSVDTRKIYKHDPSNNRAICAGENLPADASPRCFGALQPQLETCKKEDRNCDGVDFKGGEIFVTKGVACGIGTGECNVGTVKDCNLSQTLNPSVLALRKQRIANYNQYWVCSSDTVFPVQEICDGKDDDCNGSNDFRENGVITEVDVDKDKNLACKGCKAGTLSKSYYWCGDCQDSAPAIYLNAKELCNAIDDNCLNGLTDDGKDQCTGSWSCCTSQKACRQLGSDEQNCGTCGKVCPTNTTSICSGGKCVCGSSGGPCTSGLNCSGGSCKCIQNGLCNGCCDGNTCQPGSTVAKCGDNGVSCKTCSTSDPCKVPVCTSAGNCTVANRSNGTPCTGGVCISGVCCPGCVSGGNTCRTGNTTSYCGTAGENCDTCSTTDPCKNPTCNSSANCSTTNKADTTSCPNGRCFGGSCCTNCWNGSSCVGGTSTSACGDNGVNCVPCTDPGVCKHAVCPSGSCGSANDFNLTSCSGGRCISGLCCSGCISGGNTCRTGNTTSYCGTAGENCDGCTVTPGTCKVPTCNGTDCGQTNAGDTTSCTGGLCYGGSCCTGCWTGSSCSGGTSTSACGDNGVNCASCADPGVCRHATCPSGSCVPANDANGAPCTDGKCYGGGCCTGCWTGSSCASGTSTTSCGDNGDSCQTCNTAGECEADVCSGGTCSTSQVSDGASCSSGTGQCHSGSCCTGCWNGSCQPGDTKQDCGTGGVTCVPCSGSETCTAGTCG
jgi:Putative metal-binding motif